MMDFELEDDEQELWMQCKCGEELEFNDDMERTVCPACHRWGCWSLLEEEN